MVNATVRYALGSALAHKRRLAGTAFAVFLGVAFLSGTLVLSDTLRANFDSLFQSADAGTDAVIRASTSVRADIPGPNATQRGLVDAALVDRVRAVPGVAAAEPSVTGYGQLLGSDGAAVGGNGPPRRAGNWVTTAELTPYRVVDGRAPAAPGEVVVNRGAAKDGKLRVGDSTLVQTPQPVHVRIVGIATWNGGDGFGRGTFVAFGLSDAERYLTKPGRVSSVVVHADPGVSQQQLVDRLRPLLPPGTEAITGAALTDETTSDLVGGFLAFFSRALLVFAGIALLVATFSIANTFAILVAQRSRESALLRALGATRRQVLGTVLVEAALVGITASAVGLFGGLGVATLLKGLFNSFGFTLPDSGLRLSGGTVAVALAVGVVGTLLAGVAPAVAASRVPPLAALRVVATGPTTASGRRTLAGALVGAAGVAFVVTAVVGGGSGVLARAGLGAVLTVAGVVMLGPTVAAPASRLLGAPLPALRGVPGSLARANAMRNPRRTSATAAALMVGVAVVTLFTVLAASVRASTDASVRQSFGGDLAITSASFVGGNLSPGLADEVGRLPEVAAAAGVANTAVLVDGTGTGVSVSDPARLAAVLDLDVRTGSVAGLGDHRLAVADRVATDHGWRLGSGVQIGYPDGSTEQLTVGAIYRARTVVGDYLLPRTAWAPHATQDIDSMVLIGLRDGVDLATGRTAVQRVAARYGNPSVRDRGELADTLSSGVDTALSIVYALLALAVLIAAMGIANTLALSIHERTRELGVLRAIGLTRSQLRGMVRWESALIAVFGTVGGLGLGVFLGWAMVRAAGADIGSFAAPPARLLVVLAVGAAVGVLAAVRPARRAARLDVLAAIATE